MPSILPSTPHPTWCALADCLTPSDGPHLSAPLVLRSVEDDVDVTVRSGLWPADTPSSSDVAPCVELTITSRAFRERPQSGRLSPDEAAQVALTLLAAAAKAVQP